jgi:FtsP/CotA-like multicopper oxidase with cupredoxin domain
MAVNRRFLLKHAAALPFLGTVPPYSWAAGENEAVKADYTLRIVPVMLELAPGKTIRTTGYNGKVPGPALRLREGRAVTINVINDSGYPDIVHWHGLIYLRSRTARPKRARRSSRSGTHNFIPSRRSHPARAGITATLWR